MQISLSGGERVNRLIRTLEEVGVHTIFKWHRKFSGGWFE